MTETKDKDRISDIIEELKRLQVEYSNAKIRKSINDQLQVFWPQPKEINGELFIIF